MRARTTLLFLLPLHALVDCDVLVGLDRPLSVEVGDGSPSRRLGHDDATVDAVSIRDSSTPIRDGRTDGTVMDAGVDSTAPSRFTSAGGGAQVITVSSPILGASLAGSSVYILTTSGVVQGPLSGEPSVSIALGDGSIATALDHDDAGVYFGSQRGIYMYPVAAATRQATRIVDLTSAFPDASFTTVGGLVATGSEIFWTESVNGQPKILRHDREAGPTSVLVAWAAPSQGGSRAPALEVLASDDTALYVVSVDAVLWAIPRTTGVGVKVATEVSFASLAALGGAVFYLTGPALATDFTAQASSVGPDGGFVLTAVPNVVQGELTAVTVYGDGICYGSSDSVQCFGPSFSQSFDVQTAQAVVNLTMNDSYVAWWFGTSLFIAPVVTQ